MSLMLTPLEYRPAHADARHPYLALLLAGAIGVIWGFLPLCIFVGTGQGMWTVPVVFLLIWSAVVGIVAGACTIWTRGRSNGAETPTGLIGTYYAAIVLFWLGLTIIEWATYWPPSHLFGWSVLWACVQDDVALLVKLVGYGTMLGLIAVPLCYLCREQVWRTYV